MSDERMQWLGRQPNEALAKKLGIAAWILSAVVLTLVVFMQKIRVPLPAGWSTMALPAFYAGINAVVAVLLLVSLVAIKTGRIGLHRKLMLVSVSLSILFLLSYVAYHITNNPTHYGGVGISRDVYFFLLITHILSAAVSLPFILFTLIAALTNRFVVHRKLARWVFPIWLYVAVTGPICYWMLRPYYG